jgi:hypothetical protein
VRSVLYLISYDLLNHSKEEEYKELFDELQRLGAKRVLLSQWLWRGSNTSGQIRDHLMQFVHTTDRILVVEVPTNWAGNNLLFNPNHF